MTQNGARCTAGKSNRRVTLSGTCRSAQPVGLPGEDTLLILAQIGLIKRGNEILRGEEDKMAIVPAPEGRLKIARRFSAGKEEFEIKVPEGRLTSHATHLRPGWPFLRQDLRPV